MTPLTVCGLVLPTLRTQRSVSAVDFELETLEPRLLLDGVWDATVAPNGGDWNVGANWVGGVTPTSGQVTIAGLNPGGQVTFATGTANVAAISISSGSLVVTGGTVNATGGLTVSAGATLAVSGGLFQLFGATSVDGALAVSGTGVVNSYSSYDLTRTAGPGMSVSDDGIFNVYAGTVKTGNSTIVLSGNGTLNVGNEPNASPGGPSLWVNNSLSPPDGGLHASGNSGILLGAGGTLDVSSVIKIEGTAGLTQSGGTLNLVPANGTVDALASTKAVALDLQSGLITGTGTLVSKNANFGVTFAPSGITPSIFDVSRIGLEISDHTAFLPDAKLQVEIFTANLAAGSYVTEVLSFGSINAGTHTIDMSGLEVQLGMGSGFTFNHAFQWYQNPDSDAVRWDSASTITAGPARVSTFTEFIAPSGYGFSGLPWGMRPEFDTATQFRLTYHVVEIQLHLTYTFTGAINNDWFNAGNWTIKHAGTGIALDANELANTPGAPWFYANVVIPSGKAPVISSGLHVINSLVSDSPLVINGGLLLIAAHPDQISQGGWTVPAQVSALNAAVTLSGGTLDNRGALTFGSTFTASGGRFYHDAVGFGILRFNAAATFAAGVFSYRSGSMAIGPAASLTSPNALTIPYGSVLYAEGNLTVPTLTVGPNTELYIGSAVGVLAQITLTGNLIVSNFGFGGKVTMYIAGPGAAQASRLDITGTALLGGVISVFYVGGYAPTPADSATTYIGITAAGGFTGIFGTSGLGTYLSIQTLANQLVIVFTPNSTASLNVADGIDWLENFVRSAATYFNLNTIAGSPQFPVAPQGLATLFGLGTGLSGFSLTTPAVAGTDTELARALLAAGYVVDSFTDANGHGLFDNSNIPFLNFSPAPSGIKLVAHQTTVTALSGLTATGAFNAATTGLLAGLAADTSALTGVMSWTASLSVSLVFGIDSNGDFVIGGDSLITLALVGNGTVSGTVNVSGKSAAVTGTATASLSINLRLSTPGTFFAPNYVDVTGIGNLARVTATGSAGVALNAAVGPLGLVYGTNYTVAQNIAARTTSVSQTATLTGTTSIPGLVTSGGTPATLALTGAYDNGSNSWTLTGGFTDLRIFGLTVPTGSLSVTLSNTRIGGTVALGLRLPFIASNNVPAVVTMEGSFTADTVTFGAVTALPSISVVAETGSLNHFVVGTNANVTTGFVSTFGTGVLTGSMTLTAADGHYAPDAKYTAVIADSNSDGVAFTLGYNFSTGIYNIAFDRLTFTVSSVLRFVINDTILVYDRNGAPGANQVLATVSNVTVQLMGLTTATGPPAMTTAVTLSQDGVSFGDASASLNDVRIGDFLNFASLNIALAGASYTQGAASAAGSLSFSSALGVMYPGQNALVATLTNVNASQALSGAPVWGLAIGSFNITAGEAFSIARSNASLNYNPADSSEQNVMVLNGATIASSQFSEMSEATQTLVFRTTGVDFGSFSLAAASVELGSFMSLSGATITATDFQFHYGQGNPFTGTVTLGLASFDLYPGISFLTTSGTGLSGSYDFSSALADGSLGITVANYKLTVGSMLEFQAENVLIRPNQHTFLSIGLVHAKTVKLAGLTADLQNLTFTQSGFHIGSLQMFTAPGTLGTLPGGIGTLSGVAFSLTDFGYDTTAGWTGSASITVDRMVLFPGDPQYTVVATEIAGGYVTTPAGISELTFSVGRLQVELHSYGVTFIATNLVITPEASRIVTIGTVTASVDLGGDVILTGSGGNFAFNSDGSVTTLPGFGVSFSVSTAPALLRFPGWLQISLTKIGLSWPDFSNDPGNFDLILSAQVGGLADAPGGLVVAGTINDLRISLSELRAGRMPIIDVGSGSITITGPAFGGTLSGSIAIGVMRLDANGDRIAATDTTTAVAQRIFYGAVRASYTTAGRSGFSLSFGLSELGPINAYVAVSTNILLDAGSGLTLTALRAEVQFDTTLPTITSTTQLDQGFLAFTPVAALTDSQWLAKLELAVVNQANAPPGGGFWDALSRTMLIKGTAEFRSANAPPTVFRASVDIIFSTDGRFVVNGSYFLADKLNFTGRLYADLTDPANATFLFVSHYAPAGGTELKIEGSLQLHITSSVVEFRLTGSVSMKSVVKVEGSVVLSFANDQLYLRVSGRLNVIKVGNLIGADGIFRLDLSDANNPQFWGALNIQTNFEIFEQLGIHASGTAFFRINTTNIAQTETLVVPGQPAPIAVNIAPQTVSLLVTGQLQLQRNGVDWIRWTGEFGFEIGNTRTLVTMSGKLIIGPSSSPFLTYDNNGFLQIDDHGVVAHLQVSLTPNIPQIVGVTMNGSFTFQLNTTGQAATFSTPGGSYTIPAAPTGLAPGPYALVYGTATLTLVNTAVVVTATEFRLVINENSAVMSVVGTMALRVNGTALFTYTVLGDLLVDSSGVAAGFAVNLAVGGNNLGAFGLSSSYNSGFAFKLNTTGKALTLNNTVLRAGIYAEFTATLTMSVAGFDLGGAFTFSASTTAVSVTVAAGTGFTNIKAGGNVILSFSFSVGFSIVYASATDNGVVFAATLSLTTNTASLGFSLNGTFKIELNTTANARTINSVTVAAKTLHVTVTNATLTISGAVFTGSLDLKATASSISVQASLTMEISLASTRVFQFGIAGAMLLDSAGLTARFGIGLGVQPPTTTDLGISGSFTLALNTATTARTVGGVEVAARTVRVEGIGAVTILGMSITGSSVIEVNAASVAAGNIGFAVTGSLALKSGTTTYFTFNVSGALQISLTGVAARFAVALSAGPGANARLGFGAAVSYLLEINTTGLAVTFPNSVQLEAGTFVRVRAIGSLAMGGFSVAGTFVVSVGLSGLTLSAAGTMDLAVAGVSLFTFNVSGTLVLTDSGVTGLLTVSRIGQAPNLGVSFSANYQLEFNTASSNQTVPFYDSTGNVLYNVTMAAGPYVRISANGSMSAGPFTLTGFFEFTMAADRIEIRTIAALSIYGATGTVSGSFGIYADGVVLSLQLQLPTIDHSIFKLTGSFFLKINTTGRVLLGIAPATAIIGVDGAAITLKAVNLTLRGSLFIGYTDGAAFVQIDNMGMDFFGFGSVSVSGRVDSKGNFEFTGRLTDLEIGRRDYAGLAWGVMSVTVSNRGISGYLTAYAFVFGQNVGYVEGTIGGSSFSIITSAYVSIPVINMQIYGFMSLTINSGGVKLSIGGWGSLFGGIFVFAHAEIDSATGYFKVTGSFSVKVGNENLGASLSGKIVVSSNVWESGISGTATAYAGFYLYNPFGDDWWIGGSVTIGFRATLSGQVTLYIEVAGDEYGLSFDLSTIMKVTGSDISGGYAFLDLNGDGVWQNGEARAPVDADGHFTFSVGDESRWMTDATSTFAFQDLNGNGVWDAASEARLALVDGQLPAALAPVTVVRDDVFDPASTLGLLSGYALIDADGLAVINPARGQMVATGGLTVNLATGVVASGAAPVVIDSQTTGYTGRVGTGQTVFFDTNGNLALDPGEVGVAADARGYFTFTPNQAQLANLGILAGFDLNQNGKIDANEGSIVLAGGTDKSNGLPVDGIIRVSAENVGNGLALVAQPLANLQAAVVLRGYDAAVVNTRLSLVFGLPVGLDFATVDAQVGNGLTVAVRAGLMRVTSQLETYLLNASSLLVTAGVSVAAAQQAALDVLVDRVLRNYSRATQGTIAPVDMIDFSDAASLAALFDAAATKLGVSPAAATTAAVATITRELNLRAAAYAASSTNLTRDLARIDAVAKGPLATDIRELGAARLSASVFLGRYTGAALDALLAGVALTTVTPPTLTGVTDLTATLGGTPGSLALHLATATGVASNIIVTATSSNTAFLADAALSIVGSGADRVLVIQPGSTTGSATVTVTATINGVATVQTFVYSLVAAASLAPVFVTTPPTTAVVDGNFGYSILVQPGAGATLTITATGLPSWLTLSDQGNGFALLAGMPTLADLAGASATSYAITLTVTDDIGAVATQSFNLQLVGSGVSAPAFDSTLPSDLIAAGALFTYNIAVTRGTGVTSVAITSSALPGWLALTDHGDGTATLQGTPTLGDLGSLQVTLTATDNQGLTTTQGLSLAVFPGLAPVFAAQTAGTVTGGQLFTRVVTVTPRAPATSVVITAGSLPAWVTLTDHGDGTATLSGTPAFDQSGAFSVVLLATDDIGGTSTVTFAVTVTPALSLATVSNVTMAEDTARAVTLTLGGTNGSSVLVVVTATDNTLLPAGGMVVTGSGATRTLTLTPAANAIGTTNVTVTIIDGSLSVSQTFTVTVTAVDDPVASTGLVLPDFVVHAGSPDLALDLSAYFRSFDGPVTFAASSSDASLAGVTVSGNILAISPNAARSGVSTLTIIATSQGASGQVYSTTGVVRLTVLPELVVASAQIVRTDTGNVLRFVVTLLTPSNQTVRVGYATANGTAVAGIDFVAATGTLEFAPGVTQRFIDVVLADGLLLNPGNFTLGLSGAQNASVGQPSTTGTIPSDRGLLAGIRAPTLELSFAFLGFFGGTGAENDDIVLVLSGGDAPDRSVVGAGMAGGSADTWALIDPAQGNSLVDATGLGALTGLREIARY